MKMSLNISTEEADSEEANRLAKESSSALVRQVLLSCTNNRGSGRTCYSKTLF